MRIKYLILFLMLAGCTCNANPEIEEESNQNPLQRLISGNKRFLNNKSIHPHNSHDRLVQVENAQTPFAVIVTCSDSRVSPELVFDQGLGDLFVIRTAGNVLSYIEIGSIEYAIEHLHTNLVVVMGHENCGAIKAVEENAKEEGALGILINQIKNESEVQSITRGNQNTMNALVQANVIHSVRQLQTQEGHLNNHFKKGQLQIIGAEYFLHNGIVVFNN